MPLRFPRELLSLGRTHRPPPSIPSRVAVPPPRSPEAAPNSGYPTSSHASSVHTASSAASLSPMQQWRSLHPPRCPFVPGAPPRPVRAFFFSTSHRHPQPPPRPSPPRAVDLGRIPPRPIAPVADTPKRQMRVVTVRPAREPEPVQVTREQQTPTPPPPPRPSTPIPSGRLRLFRPPPPPMPPTPTSTADESSFDSADTTSSIFVSAISSSAASVVSTVSSLAAGARAVANRLKSSVGKSWTFVKESVEKRLQRAWRMSRTAGQVPDEDWVPGELTWMLAEDLQEGDTAEFENDSTCSRSFRFDTLPVFSEDETGSSCDSGEVEEEEESEEWTEESW